MPKYIPLIVFIGGGAIVAVVVAYLAGWRFPVVSIKKKRLQGTVEEKYVAPGPSWGPPIFTYYILCEDNRTRTFTTASDEFEVGDEVWVWLDIRGNIVAMQKK